MQPTALEQKVTVLPEVKKLHWMVAEIFAMARDLGLHSPSWQPFSELIHKETKLHIPPGTLKYWYAGNSTPKVEEAEAMAKALGYDLDLCLVAPSKKV